MSLKTSFNEYPTKILFCLYGGYIMCDLALYIVSECELNMIEGNDQTHYKSLRNTWINDKQGR